MRVNTKITLNPGTPVNIAVALGQQPHTMANRVFIQMAAGGTGLGYVMGGIYGGRTPATTNGGDVSAELGASPSATNPGGSWSDPDSAIEFSLAPAVDLTTIWVDGTAADPVRVSADLNV